MSENILYRFAKDLSQLYAKTHLREIENSFIKVAQVFEEELEKWLLKSNQTNVKIGLSNPEVFDAIVTLARIRKAHPAGMSTPEFFQMAMNEPGILRFLPMFLVLKNVAESHDYAVLNPLKSILSAVGNAKDRGTPPDASSVANSVNSLDAAFRDYLEHVVERTYDDDAPTSHKKKPNRKERIASLLRYLIRRFSDEIVAAFEQTGQIDAVGISENLNNPKKILDVMYPDYPPSSMQFLVNNAKRIVKDAIKYVDPTQYDIAYNTIKAEIMLLSAIISRKQYYEFKYNASLELQSLSGEVEEESDRIKVSPSVWNYPQNIVLLSAILFIIGSKMQ